MTTRVETPARGFGQAALPVLLERVRGATARVGAVDARVRADPQAAVAEAAGELSAALAESDELGWLLGMVARELGADLLRARQERAGLAPLVRLVQVTLLRAGRVVRVAPERLPEVEPASGVLVELCAWTAELLWISGMAQPAGAGARLELSARGLEFTGLVEDTLAAGVECAAQLSPLVSVACTPSSWQLCLPPGWLTEVSP